MSFKNFFSGEPYKFALAMIFNLGVLGITFYTVAVANHWWGLFLLFALIDLSKL